MTNHISQNPKWRNEEFERDITQFYLGYNQARKEILDFIETERDNGNTVVFKGTGKCFSASLCLSDLIKKLKDTKDKQ